MMRLLGFLSITLAALVPSAAFAHAFGQTFGLPLPVSFYVLGGASAFLASCAVLILIGGGRELRSIAFTLPPGVRRGMRFLLRLVLMGFFLLALAAGFLGHDAPYDNLLTISFWIGLVLLIPYLSVLLDGWWEIGNPFRRISSFFEGEEPPSRLWRWGYVPALVGYALLIILELFLVQYSISALFLAAFLIFFTTVLAAGVMVYGKQWGIFADFFSLFYRLAGLLAPLRITAGKLVLESPVSRLVREKTDYLSLPAFIIFALAATAFDGLRETAVWYRIIGTFPGDFMMKSFIGFALLPFAFFGLYALAMYATKRIVRDGRSLRWYVTRFAFSLVPIMIAYHFAHYFTLILTTGAYAIPLFSDPLGQGWNLFGTADYYPNILIGAQWIWYVQFGTIVLGHIFAAYVSHKIALSEWDHFRAITSQLPLVVLMVVYTAFGLWILGQPYAPGAF